SVALWFGLGSDSIPDFTTRTNVKWWSAGEVVRGASGGAFSYVLKSEPFNTDRKTLYCAAVVIGKNKQRSPLKTASFMIGRVRPSNPVILHALALNANSIALTWNKLNPDSVERVRIYFKTGSEFTNDHDFSNVTPKDSVVPAPLVADTADTVFRLNEKTRYYFAAQVYRQGIWSRVVAESKATDSTREADSSTIINKVTVRSIVFDTSSNQVKIVWDVDTIVGSNLQIGISWSLLPVTPQDSTIKKALDVLAARDSTVIDLGEALRFDTTFTFYLWLKKAGEKWASPTDASTGTVRIPPFVWQSVRYSVKYLADDTTLWVNDRIRFATNKVFSPNDAQNYVGKIHRFDGEPLSLHGFIVVGQSFLFTEKQSSMPLEVGLKCHALPSAFSLRDVRMYRWNGTSWILNRATGFDTAASMVYVRTSELDEPFAAMIDTLHPVVTILSSKKDSLERNESVSDTLEVSDNIGNLVWSFRCIEGDKSLAASDSSQKKTLSKKTDTAYVSIAQTLVSEENGVRAAFITDDGRFSDTVRMSRRVIRVLSDATPIAEEMSWKPLRVTAELDTPSVRRLWRMVDTTLADPKYDKRFIRLFRWYPHASNASNDQRWLEYAPEHDTIFSFLPGRLFWVKLRNPATFVFGRALTMPLHDTVSLHLNAKGWTDFALPFRFGIRIGDIVAATRNGSAYADSLQFYRWDTTGTTYKCSPMYLAGLEDEGLRDSSAEVSSRDLAGYSVYNPMTDAMALRIPPTPLAMSEIRAVQKPAAGNGWSVRVDSRIADGSFLTPVYCGYKGNRTGGERYYPLAPTFHEISVGVYDEKSGGIYGHKICHAKTNGGCSYLLVFRNTADKAQQVQFSLRRLGALPSDFTTALYDPVTGEALEIGGDEAAVTVGAHCQEYRWLLAGNGGFINGASKVLNPGILAFAVPFPNPMRTFVHLRYTIPFAGVSRVEFTIVDIRGRVVWQKAIREKTVVGGNRVCVWNGTTSTGQRLASGLYIVKMTAYDLKHKSIGSFDERITVVR
ncbi:MAG: hypothetical protein JXA71_17755, partial [Chitinispirillaceae bacterium]|nr:hypothetical protein [Chitinispirillaceae bacterium]